MRVSGEFEGADLGDERRERRLSAIVERLAAEPQKSIAGAMKDAASREATYRFLNNEDIDPEAILAPHIAATSARVAALGSAIIAHDTSEFVFSTPREGLGRQSNDDEEGRAFFLHAALAISADGRRDVLGVLGAETFQRNGPRRHRKHHHTHKQPEQNRESTRWWQMMAHVAEQLPREASAIHVMDREADNYLLLARLIEGKHRFVIRLKHDRRIELDGSKDPTLQHALSPLTARVSRQITVRRKLKPLASRRLPPIRLRTAKLELRATPATLKIPHPLPKTEMEMVPPTLSVNVVHVVEIDPPEGCEPVDWKLVTTEPITTVDDVNRVVDTYDTRWIIEEYFKSLKTGCAFEKRELENARAIYNALAVFLPIAWSLLRLRCRARDPETAGLPASTVLTKLQIVILQRHKDIRMEADNPTVADAWAAIAQLGGHIKNNGEPGWQVLGRGFLELLTLELGASLALEAYL